MRQDKTLLYLVQTEQRWEYLKPEPVFPDEAWLQEIRGKGLCPQCNHIDRSRYPEPLDVVLNEPPGEETSLLIETTGITIWRRAFLEILSEHLQGLVLGRCLLPDGKILDEYVTCYSREYIVVRGNRRSRYRICPTCGAIDSEVKPGPRYVLARYLTNADIHQDARCRLFVSEGIASAYDPFSWNASIEAISVRDRPADGQRLPGDQ